MGIFNVFISSAMRTFGDRNSFRVPLNQPVINVSSIELLSSTVPNSQYLIDAQNNRFTLVEDVTIDPFGLQTFTDIVIPSSNYTPTTMAAFLAAALTNLSPAGWIYTVTFNEPTLHFNIVSNSPYRFSFQFANLGNPNANTSLNQILGMNADNPAALVGGPPAWTLSSPNVVDFIRTRHYFITLSPYNAYCKTARGFSFTFMVPNRAPAGNLGLYDAEGNYNSFLAHNDNLTTITYFDVELRDQDGQLIELNGVDWSMYVQIKSRQ